LYLQNPSSCFSVTIVGTLWHISKDYFLSQEVVYKEM
jgi:hypothetical protein